jgi:hypothetical protein
LTATVAAPDAMANFNLPRSAIDDIVAYLNSLPRSSVSDAPILR